jgi:hypothetical protein
MAPVLTWRQRRDKPSWEQKFFAELFFKKATADFLSTADSAMVRRK